MPILNSMRILEKYTFQICTNENIFPNESDLVFTLQILDICLDASAELECAFHNSLIFPNSLYARRIHQTACYLHLNSLLHLIEYAWKTYNISSRHIKYWASLVVLTKKNLDVWVASDLNI